LAGQFYKQGGEHLFLDEVHKYPNWAIEIKSIYDDFPSLRIVFSGSSALLLHQSGADLSRRSSVYRLYNLSFREFVHFKTGIHLSPVTLTQVMGDHMALSSKINQQIRPLVLFGEYLKSGAYPYYFEYPALFHEKLAATVKTIIEADLMAIASFTYSSIVSLQKVLALIADSVPFKPNISELSRKSGVARDILLKMIDLLIRADLLLILRQDSFPTGYLTKPEKLYLHNSSLAWALSINRNPDIGTVRETFFLNQISAVHQVTLPQSGDFLVDGRYTFEVGGAGKTKRQIKHVNDGFVVQDNIENGFAHTIPLWLFGFLY
jgi:predicted AAA+ superfamily ATPase